MNTWDVLGKVSGWGDGTPPRPYRLLGCTACCTFVPAIA